MMYKANFGGVTLQGRKMMKDEGHYTERKSEIWVICNLKFPIVHPFTQAEHISLKDLFDLEGGIYLH